RQRAGHSARTTATSVRAILHHASDGERAGARNRQTNRRRAPRNGLSDERRHARHPLHDPAPAAGLRALSAQASMGTWRVDTSQWPIVIHSVEGIVTDEQLDAYIRKAETVLARRQPHATILDATKIGRVSAYTRARAIEWQREHAAELKAYC